MPNITSFHFRILNHSFDLILPCFIWQAVLSKMTDTDESIIHIKGEEEETQEKT